MKNQTRTYVLLVVVLGIWGVVGFRLIATLNPEVQKDATPEDRVTFSPIENISDETFSIQLPERDPFLGTLHIKKESKVDQKSPINKEPIVWASVLYHGAIARQDSNQKIYIISINGQQHIVKVGHDIEGVKLLKATDKAIVVSYKGLKKTIEKT